MIIQDDPTQGTPRIAPGVGSSYSNGLNKLSKYFLNLFLIVLVAMVFGIPSILSSVLHYTGDAVIAINILLYFYSFFVTTPLEYGVSYTYLKAARDEKPGVQDLTIVLSNYWNILFASILAAIIITAGFFLFIIPGFYFACKLAFVRYLIVDEKMSALQAIDESWRMTNGHAGTIFLMGIVAIPIVIAGILLFGIGVIFSGMWIEAAFASMYHAVSLEKKTTSPVIEQQGPFV